MPDPVIASYITPHGFGHAVRACAVLRAIHRLAPQVQLTVVTDLDRSFLENYLPGIPFRLRQRVLDVGLVQRDSVRFDLAASLDRLRRLRAEAGALVAAERAFLQAAGVRLVVADVPFLAVQAAAAAGIPAVAVSNFSWDWIYQDYAAADPDWAEIVAWVTDCYRPCNLVLQLPMGQVSAAFRHRLPVPLVASTNRLSGAAVRARLGLAADDKVCLIAFGRLDLPAEAIARLAQLGDWRFLFRRPVALSLPNGVEARDWDLSFPDLVAAASVVISKPGYGVVSDCLAQAKPLVWCQRGPFAEVPYLLAAVRTHLPEAELATAALYAGDWGPALAAALAQPPGPPVERLDGAEVCARLLVDCLHRKWSTPGTECP
ncbi:MAG: hypothetical protein AB1634_14545 [Thermodesulfobacteriota bacterium]